MRFLRFGEPGHERPGVLVGERVAADVADEVSDVTRAWFAGGGVDQLRPLMDDNQCRFPVVSLDDVRLGPSVPWPHQLLCIGMNCADHAAETGQLVPDEPVVFDKAPNCLSGPHDDVLLASGGQQVDWEDELAVVIGARTRYLPDPTDARRAWPVSQSRTMCRHGASSSNGEGSGSTECPARPSTRSDSGWSCRTRPVMSVTCASASGWNGELVQHGSTATMVFGVDHLVWYLSQFMFLEPGDIINTGTRPESGLPWPHPASRDGDVMELEIDWLGRQRQVVRRASV